MGYVVTPLWFAPTARVESAVDAMEACVALHNNIPGIAFDLTDDDGQRLEMAELLHLAIADANLHATRRRLTAALADLLEGLREETFQDADDLLELLDSGQITDSAARLGIPYNSAETRAGLAPTLRDHGSWCQAGMSWAAIFAVNVPHPVFRLLAARRGRGFSADAVWLGVIVGLAGLESRRHTRSGVWPENRTGCAPRPNGGARPGRPRGSR